MIHVREPVLRCHVDCYHAEGRDKVHDLCFRYEGQMSTITAKISTTRAQSSRTIGNGKLERGVSIEENSHEGYL